MQYISLGKSVINWQRAKLLATLQRAARWQAGTSKVSRDRNLDIKRYFAISRSFSTTLDQILRLTLTQSANTCKVADSFPPMSLALQTCAFSPVDSYGPITLCEVAIAHSVYFVQLGLAVKHVKPIRTQLAESGSLRASEGAARPEIFRCSAFQYEDGLFLFHMIHGHLKLLDRTRRYSTCPGLRGPRDTSKFQRFASVLSSRHAPSQEMRHSCMALQ
jgi:hypothetical protein